MKKPIYPKLTTISLLILITCFIMGFIKDLKTVGFLQDSKNTEIKTARVVANGDILIHDVVYVSAKKEDGSYDFTPFFQYVKEHISAADLAIGDYEGTINPDTELSGYPIFNAPSQIADAMAEAGYDVVDLAHNHILDTGIDGALNTIKTFENLGLTTMGFYKENRETEEILVREVNGIKIAMLAYAYGYNGLEESLTEEERAAHLSDLDEGKMEAEIKRAEEIADVTIVMPQMGVEYALEPTEKQITLYHKLVDWGADVVFGGHPHVVEPAETLTKDGEKKFIIYSMGNFISNQQAEIMEDKWPERGLLMDVTFEKRGDKTLIKTVQAHPTLVWYREKGYDEGMTTYDYRIMILSDFIQGGKYREELDDDMKVKVDTAYAEMNEHVNLQWD